MRAEAVPADASTLIYLAKADAFAEIEHCVPVIAVPPAVWREAVVDGERIGAPEVPRIVAAPVLRQVELTLAEQSIAESIATEHRLGQGESEVLALGLDVGRAIVDEGRASRVATTLGLVPVSTLFLPILGHRAGMLRVAEAIDLLRRLAVVTSASADAVFAIEESLK